MSTSAALVNIQALSPADCADFTDASSAVSRACGSGVDWPIAVNAALRNSAVRLHLFRREIGSFKVSFLSCLRILLAAQSARALPARRCSCLRLRKARWLNKKELRWGAAADG